MARYIDAEKLKEHIMDLPTWVKEDDWWSSTKYPDGHFDCDDIINSINNAPTADVVEVKHGYWEIVKGSNGKEKMVCTNCRHQQDLHSTFTYCPNCGALIDGRVIHDGRR